MDLFIDRVTAAAMTDLKIDWGGLEVTDVYPKTLPDLYVDRPIVLTGRFRGAGTTSVKVTGRAGASASPTCPRRRRLGWPIAS